MVRIISQGVLLAFELPATGEHSDAEMAAALNTVGYRANNKYTKKPKPNPKRKSPRTPSANCLGTKPIWAW